MINPIHRLGLPLRSRMHITNPIRTSLPPYCSMGDPIPVLLDIVHNPSFKLRGPNRATIENRILREQKANGPVENVRLGTQMVSMTNPRPQMGSPSTPNPKLTPNLLFKLSLPHYNGVQYLYYTGLGFTQALWVTAYVQSHRIPS